MIDVCILIITKSYYLLVHFCYHCFHHLNGYLISFYIILYYFLLLYDFSTITHTLLQSLLSCCTITIQYSNNNSNSNSNNDCTLQAEKWKNTIVALVREVVSSVDPNVRKGDSLDIKPYVKLKTIPGK